MLKKISKKILTTMTLIIIALSIATPMIITPTYAGAAMDPSYRPINMPFGRESIVEGQGVTGAAYAMVVVLQTIAGGLLYFAAPVAIILIAFSGSSMVLGSHETEKIDQAKKSLTWSIIGLATIIFSYTLVRIIIAFIITAASTAG